MLDNIRNEINEIKQIAARNGLDNLSDEMAFNYLVVQYYCFGEPVVTDELWFDIKNCITDGSKDGGMDYVFFDEEESKVIIGQNKYSSNESINSCVNEINKTIRTIEDFRKSSAGLYNQKVRETFQNAADQLTDETEGNFELVFASISDFDEKEVMRRLENVRDKVSQITIINATDISATIEKIQETTKLVKEDSFDLDRANNSLMYNSDDKEGIVVNIQSASLARIYNKYNNKGLFNLNIRRYISNKNVDEGINNTLNNNREDFWFLNNGLTIACRDYRIDGTSIKLYDFSIVNGGQTTTLIGKYSGIKTTPFSISCRIIKPSENLTDEKYMRFCNEIAEATNSQKPIQPKDLKSNAPEMIQLQRVLSRQKVAFDIKRGETNVIRNPRFRIRNDDFAQLIFSFVNQRPGTARSNKKSLFSNNNSYNKIFLKKYNEASKMEFVLDLLDLNERFDILAQKYKKDSSLNVDEANIFFNGKCVLFALFGVAYRIVNKDIALNKIKSDPNILGSDDFQYSKFISNYVADDIDEALDSLIKLLLAILAEMYKTKYDNKEVTSISNFFKTDKMYLEGIVVKVLEAISRSYYQREFDEYAKVLLRSDSLG